ncbi:sporangia-induced kinesin [Thraustotheca clavata]|uniref:Kinesin-like protein n=1 Tax=Thraustotheca clavata TaxID=74557 RepID=A0A1V9YZY3_9STRA|nr:sporangia-induced kinesin [Thraustotheca clavata]
MPLLEPEDLLPIPEWMKAKARDVSTQSVTWQKPAVYHGVSNPLRNSCSGGVKLPVKLIPLNDVGNNQQSAVENEPLMLQMSVTKSLNVLQPCPSCSPVKSIGMSSATSVVLTQETDLEASPEETNEQNVNASVNIPLRQSRMFNEVNGSMNKWRARAIANPFVKRKNMANNEATHEAPPTEIARNTTIVKSSFKMQPTNQEEPINELRSTKVQHSPQKDIPHVQAPHTTPELPPSMPSPPRSPKWDGEMAPRPKKPQPKRPGKGKSSCVGALAEIQRKREERRTLQAQEKNRKDAELKEHGDDTGYKFRRLIKAFRDTLPPRNSKQIVPVQSSSKLCVYVRKRPLSKKELAAKGYDVITCLQAKELICHEPKFKVDMSESLENHQFSFDGVFHETEDNDMVYKLSVGPWIPSLVQGNGILTVFAYGQTGSGKTYTMKSVYRQAANDLFSQLKAHAKGSVTVGVSFYDIYKNGVCDLLNQRKKVQALEDNEGVVQLLGLTELPISNETMLTDLVDKGEASRITSINGVHDDSSRSHAILRVTLYSGSQIGGNVEARLSMVDLAGSERACETQTDDKSTRMEGAEINKSLLALKECIRAMDRGAKHLPFRQSKLTQILRDSFMCETSKTVMIATVSPCSEHSNHTLNTLRYADRLKEINSRDD